MPYMKDEMKKKDSEKLEEMQEEIDEAEAHNVQDKDTDDAEDKDKKEETAAAQKSAEENDADELAAQLDAGKKALAEAEDRFKRLQADFINFRRRSSQEKADLTDFVLQGFLKDMLPVLDNFERAVSAQEQGHDSESFSNGVKMILTQFREILVKNGLEVIKTEGAKFDPNFHQAVMRVQDADKEDDIIEQELQKGYMVHGHVIRPSMVKVVSN